MSIKFNGQTVFFDIESHSADELGTMPPEDFFILGQWAWGEGPVHTTTDINVLRRVLLSAKMIVGANIIAFDLPAVFGDTMAAVRLARQGRVMDTHVFAMTANPPPFGTFTPYTGGKPLVCTKPEHFRKWIKLDQQAYSLGVIQKTGDINDIADRFMYREVPVLTKTGKQSMMTDKATGEKVPRMKKVPIDNPPCCKFAAIPVDDEQFLAYAERDVVVVREVARKQLERHPWDSYSKREMVKVASVVQIGKGNRFRVDLPLTRARVREQHEEAAWILNDLHDRFDVPTNRKKPLATKEGKEAILRALEAEGVPSSALERTDSGAPSFSAESIQKAVAGKGEAAERLGAAVATLAGQRSLGELLLAEVDDEGWVRPDIFPFQRSGRYSTTRPGLTIWDPRWKDCLIADSDDHLLVEFDYSQADARAVAAMSGDKEFAKRFLPGSDGHMINAIAAWGEEEVAKDPKGYRQRAKAPGHGWGYKMGARKMAETTGLPEAECKKFIQALNRKYPGVVAWQKRVTQRAERYGYIVNQWGRRMPVEPGREHTQTPALLGQGATHEILNDGILRCDERHLRMIKVTIHDAFIASIPKATLEEDIEYFLEKFSTVWHPEGGQPIEFTLGYGEPARDWAAAAH